MKPCFTPLLLTVLFMTVGTLSLQESQAEIITHLTTDLTASDECSDCVVVNEQTQLVKASTLVADAAYNGSKKQEKRARIVDELGCEVLSFNATDSSLNRDFPAGLICFRMLGNSPQMIIAYRGTEFVESRTHDLSVDFYSKKSKGSIIGLDGYVHTGFLNLYLQSQEALHFLMNEIAEVHGFKLEEIQQVFTGHSLGAALATLSASVTKQNQMMNNEIYLVTFASPRVVDSQAAGQIEKLLENRILRLWREGDVVSAVSLGTSIPFLQAFTGFRHVGKDYHLNSKALNPLKNHSMVHYLNEATSDEKAEVKHQHIGFWNRLKSRLKRFF